MSSRQASHELACLRMDEMIGYKPALFKWYIHDKFSVMRYTKIVLGTLIMLLHTIVGFSKGLILEKEGGKNICRMTKGENKYLFLDKNAYRGVQFNRLHVEENVIDGKIRGDNVHFGPARPMQWENFNFISVKGVRYNYGFGLYPFDDKYSFCKFSLEDEPNVRHFTALFGMADQGKRETGTGHFMGYVFVDGEQMWQGEIRGSNQTAATREISFDIPAGATSIAFIVNSLGDKTCDYAVFLNPELLID